MGLPHTYISMAMWLLCCLSAATLHATPVPEAKPVHIEVRHGWGSDRLIHDQCLYAGTAASDIARMDAAFVAKDLAITQQNLSSLINRTKIKNYKRAKKLIQRYGADDAEREALMKAWKGMNKR